MWTCIMHPFFLDMMHDKKLLLGAELSMNFCTSAAGDRLVVGKQLKASNWSIMFFLIVSRLSTRDFSELQNSKECIRKSYDYMVLSNGVVDETLLISGGARISSDTAQGLFTCIVNRHLGSHEVLMQGSQWLHRRDPKLASRRKATPLKSWHWRLLMFMFLYPASVTHGLIFFNNREFQRFRLT